MKLTDTPQDLVLKVKEEITLWVNTHNNPYDMGINEKTYWTMLDLLRIVNENNVDTIKCMFDRFKYYY